MKSIAAGYFIGQNLGYYIIGAERLTSLLQTGMFVKHWNLYALEYQLKASLMLAKPAALYYTLPR